MPDATFWTSVGNSVPLLLTGVLHSFRAQGVQAPEIALLAIETPGATRGHRGKWIMS